MIRNFQNLIHRFRTDETGSSTIEFVLWFPLFMSIMLSSVEVGVLMIRQVMLDRAVEITVRDLRLGTVPNMDAANLGDLHNTLKELICERGTVLGAKCESTILLELRVVDQVTWNPLSVAPTCYDVEADQTESSLDVGNENELMIIRACVRFDPFFPGTGLVMDLPRHPTTGDYALIATSAFVNEPENADS
ncbi:TadE/TadG family type IV pilus assembly protein [Halocynthiibacter namhaensis]|uniref:TadE/TadG family type IV pilus assembly protein n=1 Tax=Halocynthiibacter namhaensis TaxID=1290553 RepID=UPI000691AFCA|nr:TadE family protein [Halocynthiibacter namhaensis]